MIRSAKKSLQLIDTYLLSRWMNRPSTTAFWYLPEPPVVTTTNDLDRYKISQPSPPYLMDYRQKLNYKLENAEGIIVLPYQQPIGEQINPEAAFQYALGLHDNYLATQQQRYLEKFWHYADYFLVAQSAEGLWAYNFDWYESKAPWYSALAQSRGAAVMLRAWLLSRNEKYLIAAKHALYKFTISTRKQGFLHLFPENSCPYFEEYPEMPSGVINGFMAALLSIWEMQYWVAEAWLKDLWELGINSLEKMLPYYSNGWWSLYDLDDNSPIKNVNSPRYHLLEINYLKTLSVLASSNILSDECAKRAAQYRNPLLRVKALSLKVVRKVAYR